MPIPKSCRGYTEHEMLDELGIIHMNGRVYDPYIGRFMSADPYIQAPYELQSHNRYAYVMNNPLLYTDPSGYSWWTRLRDNVIKPLVIIGVAYVTGGGFWGAVAGGAAGGAAGAALNGGNLQQVLRGAVVGGFSAALFYGAGNIGQSYGQHGVAHYAAHAIAGCVSSVAGGGRCGSGAASALLGLGVTEATSGSQWNTLTRGIAVSAAGGVGSMISGGSFVSGARTAAYGYLFNCLAHKCSTTMYDRDDPSTHLSEPIASPILCNTSTTGCLGAAQTELGCNSAPGQSSCTAVGETKSYTLTGGHGVTQYRPSTDMIINGTDVNHILADGYVVRWLAVNSADDVRIWSAGYGTNTSPTMALLNKVGGFFIFTNKGNNNWKNLAPYRAN